MDRTYTTGDVSKRFNVERKTVRDWADKYFTDYLSDSASPGPNITKRFTDADLRVFSLWAQYHSEGRTVEETIADLEQGIRGEPPAEPYTQRQQELALNQLLNLKNQLQNENDELQKKLEELQSGLDDAKQIASKAEGERDAYKMQLEATQSRLEDVLIELALLKHQPK